MGTILMLGWDGGGNVPPMVALGHWLRRRGWRVRLVGTATMAARAAAAGLHFTPFVRARSWAPEPGRALEDDYAAYSIHLGGTETGDDLLAATAEEDPDAIVVDCMARGAVSAAEYLGVPTAVLVHLRHRFFADAVPQPTAALEQLNQSRARCRLPPVEPVAGSWTELWRRAGRVVVTGLPELEGGDLPPPEHVTYVGSVSEARTAPLPEPAATFVREGTAPLTVVSLSSTYMHQERQLAQVIGALGGLCGVVTVGNGIDPATLPSAASLLVARWLPHATLLRRADVVVTHAGYGTVMAALSAGVPLVCLPMGRDQDGNADAVASLGAGIRLQADATAVEIRAAIDMVLAEPAYRTSARRLAARNRELGGGRRLADLVVELAAAVHAPLHHAQLTCDPTAPEDGGTSPGPRSVQLEAMSS